MRRALTIAVAILLLGPMSASAWHSGLPKATAFAQTCPTYNTTELTVNGAAVIANCVFNTGPNGLLYLVATGEVTCGPLSDAALLMYAGVGRSAPTIGANFNGSITGGVLTVTSMVTNIPFIIMNGQSLFDAKSGTGIPNTINGSTLTVTGQIDGTYGGVGHYSVSDNSVSVASELMWSLSSLPVSGKLQISRGLLEENACVKGSTSIVSVNAILRNNDFAAKNLSAWVILLLMSENIAGQPPQSASWNNGQIVGVTLK